MVVEAVIAAVIICLLLSMAAFLVSNRELPAGRSSSALAAPRPELYSGASRPPQTDEPDFPPPIRFNQYHAVELARGGVGKVYRCTHPQSGTVYAVKQLNREFVSDEMVVDAFHRGASMLMELRHPHIVKVYYDWTERNEGWQDHYFVMEYLPGETLHDLIRREAPMNFDQRFMDTVWGIGEAISYLHSRDIVHRDIKPENFRLADGFYKLLDFDTAFNRRDRVGLSGEGMPVGTPEYMSPEQARGAPDIDARADLYSFAILLYELFTGNVPFTGAPSRVLIDQMETAPRSPRLFQSAVPDAAADIIMMALSKDRNRRFQSIHAMLSALQNAYNAGRPTQFPAEDRGQR